MTTSSQRNTRDGFPPGLPEQLSGPAVWRQADLPAPADLVSALTPLDLAELAAATAPWHARVEADPGALNHLTPSAFPLPTLAPKLAAWRRELLHGRGFILARGLPLQDWGRRFAAVAFYGLGVHLGQPRPQNAEGHLLGHVRDLGLSSDDPNVRVYQTHERQTFHTDSADIVGLLCLQTARSGGESALVSSAAVYNELRRRRPDLAQLLFQPLAMDRRGEVPPGGKPYFEIPIFHWFAGQFSAFYQRQYFDSAQRFADAPRLTAEHVAALDFLDSLMEEPHQQFTMSLTPGDLQFVNNHTILHDRTAFDDWPNPQRRRHLLRLWLAPIDARPLPPVFALRYGSVELGKRGGVAMPESGGVMPLPAEGSDFPKAP